MGPTCSVVSVATGSSSPGSQISQRSNEQILWTLGHMSFPAPRLFDRLCLGVEQIPSCRRSTAELWVLPPPLKSPRLVFGVRCLVCCLGSVWPVGRCCRLPGRERSRSFRSELLGDLGKGMRAKTVNLAMQGCRFPLPARSNGVLLPLPAKPRPPAGFLLDFPLLSPCDQRRHLAADWQGRLALGGSQPLM